MLGIVYLLEKFLILISIVKKDKVVNGNKFSKTNQNLSKFQKLKNLTILFIAKTTGFLISKDGIVFFY